MELKIYSLEGTKYEGKVEQVSMPTTNGIITVLPHHTALITTLSSGVVEYENEKLTINGGFAEIGNNKVVILVN